MRAVERSEEQQQTPRGSGRRTWVVLAGLVLALLCVLWPGALPAATVGVGFADFLYRLSQRQ